MTDTQCTLLDSIGRTSLRRILATALVQVRSGCIWLRRGIGTQGVQSNVTGLRASQGVRLDDARSAAAFRIDVIEFHEEAVVRLPVQESNAIRLGLDRLEEDKIILAFGRWAKGQIKKWIDYARGRISRG